MLAVGVVLHVVRKRKIWNKTVFHVEVFHVEMSTLKNEILKRGFS